jgi:1-acyl-sn-glycerol-3-phosphate acyltransferase
MSDFDSTLRRLGEACVNAALRPVWGIKTTGLEKVPRTGPLIVAFNHATLLDAPMVGVALAPARRPCFLAKKELFAVPLLGPFLLRAGTIPLDRGANDHSALRAALELLAAGGTVAMSPEGTRVKPGAPPRAPKPGVGFLAAQTGAPVLPARVVGAVEFPRAFPLEVRFGDPLPPPAAGREAAFAFARAVMEAVYAL